MTTLFLLFVIFALIVYIRQLEQGGLGSMSRAALIVRLTALELFRVPCALVCLDVRGMHALNAVLGYETANKLISHLIRTKDLRGQYGGDEIVIAVPMAKTGTASNIMHRIIAKAQEMTTELTDAQRSELVARTAGKIDGFHVAIIAVDCTRRPMSAVARAMDELETMKERGATICGDRDKTGNPGTLISEVVTL